MTRGIKNFLQQELILTGIEKVCRNQKLKDRHDFGI